MECGGESETCVKGEDLFGPVNANPRFGVFSDLFLEEVCFAVKADRLHPLERVSDFEVAIAAKA